MKKLAFLLLIFFLGCTSKPTHPYKLSICAIFKDEAKWLKEWVVYHHAVLGVEHFYLYNNESSDEYESVLKPFIESGLVELYDWDSENPAHLAYGPFMDAPWNAAQLGAYNDCLKNKALGVSKWVAMIDIDEFIVPKSGVKSFYKLLDQAEKKHKGTVSIPWRMFGTSGVETLNEGELLTEKMVRRSVDEDPKNQTVKSIHRPEAIEFCLIHIAEKLKPGFGAKTFKPHLVQLNHYWARTLEFCRDKRGLSSGNDFLESLEQVQDRDIFTFLPQLKEAMNKNNL